MNKIKQWHLKRAQEARYVIKGILSICLFLLYTGMIFGIISGIVEFAFGWL